MKNAVAKIKNILLKARKDQKGNSLLEVVINIALFVAIGSSIVYATLVIEDARKHSLEETKAVISETGIVTALRSDVSNARSLSLNDVNKSLSIGKTDGTCVSWSLYPEADNTISLVRAEPQNSLRGELATGMKNGSLTVGSDKVAVKLEYPSGKKFEEKVPLELIVDNGDACS